MLKRCTGSVLFHITCVFPSLQYNAAASGVFFRFSHFETVAAVTLKIEQRGMFPEIPSVCIITQNAIFDQRIQHFTGTKRDSDDAC